MPANIVSYYEINMAYSGKTTLGVTLKGIPNQNSPGDVSLVILTPGSNRIDSPKTTAAHPISGVIIIPPDNSAGVMALKGLDTDVGIPLVGPNPTALSLIGDCTGFWITLTDTSINQYVRFVWL